MIQRKRWKSLLQAVKDYRDHPLVFEDKGLLMEDVYAKYGLSIGSQGYIGHGIALYDNDDYLEEACQSTFDRIIAFIFLIELTYRYVETVKQDKPSPFLYPWGGKQSICDVLKEYIMKDSHCDVLLQQYCFFLLLWCVDHQSSLSFRMER